MIAAKVAEHEWVEKVPAPVIQPLPADEPRALRCLFFLFMPEPFRLLARFSFMGQQALLPKPRAPPGHQAREATVMKLIDERVAATHGFSWASHFNKFSGRRDARDASVTLHVAPGDKVPEHPGPTQASLCASESDGIWHPDDFSR